MPTTTDQAVDPANATPATDYRCRTCGAPLPVCTPPASFEARLAKLQAVAADRLASLRIQYHYQLGVVDGLSPTGAAVSIDSLHGCRVTDYTEGLNAGAAAVRMLAEECRS